MLVHIVDAFTHEPFSGNPAAVVSLKGAEWPADGWLRTVAAEFGLSETAFLRHSAGDLWELRWFTPVVEDDLCGHATLAAAHVIREEGGGVVEEGLRFRTRSGLLAARFEPDGAIALDFPAATMVSASEGMGRSVIGATPEAAFRSSLRDLVLVLKSEAAVSALRPDLVAVAELCRLEGFRGVVVTARAHADHRGAYDFVSRFFAPADGIPEDPVTGSTHTALGPYWAGVLDLEMLTGLQASPRGGLVRVATTARGRVRLSGHGVTVLRGHLSDLAMPPALAI